MTDPNYWLAAWLSVMAVFFSITVRFSLEPRDNRVTVTLTSISVINLVAALYCAGFVVVMQ